MSGTTRLQGRPTSPHRDSAGRRGRIHTRRHLLRHPSLWIHNLRLRERVENRSAWIRSGHIRGPFLVRVVVSRWWRLKLRLLELWLRERRLRSRDCGGARRRGGRHDDDAVESGEVCRGHRPGRGHIATDRPEQDVEGFLFGVTPADPRVFIVSAASNADNGSFINCGTSMASPHVAGTVSLYLQGRPSISNCNLFPIQGPSVALGAAIATCPDRVTRFLKSNSNLDKVANSGGTDHFGVPVTSPNRLVWSAFVNVNQNPIDNQRFFVWSHYADFLSGQPEPDNGGLNFWTGNITGPCGVDFNGNNACTHTKRIDVSRAFWVAAFPSLFTANGSQLTNNSSLYTTVEVYLRPRC